MIRAQKLPETLALASERSLAGRIKPAREEEDMEGPGRAWRGLVHPPPPVTGIKHPPSSPASLRLVSAVTTKHQNQPTRQKPSVNKTSPDSLGVWKV